MLTTKLKLGLIDGEDCPYNSIGYSQNDTESAHELSLQASEQSIVMLKNDGVLPLDVNKVKSIAVIGPNANTVDVLLGNYNGTPSEYFTVLAANESGRRMLPDLRRTCPVPVVVKPADAPDCRQRALSDRADALYTLAMQKPQSSGFFKRFSPYMPR